MSGAGREVLEEIEPYVSLGFESLEIGTGRVRLAVPLEGNRNDKGTMFGGSIAAAMMLAGWRLCVAWAEAEGLDTGGILVRDQSVRYLRPVTGRLVAEARLASPPAATRRGNLAFDVTVEAGDRDDGRCATMRAAFRLTGPRAGAAG